MLNKTEGQLRGMKERLNLNQKFNPFTDEEKSKIENFYNNNLNEIDLDNFAKTLGRQKTSISRYARKVGLTKDNRPFSEDSINKRKNSLLRFRNSDKYQSKIKPQQTQLLTYYAQNKHPMGMKDKHHSDLTRNKMSLSRIELFESMSYEEKHAIAMKAVETKRKNGGFHTTSNAYSRCKGGFRKDIGCYFRSAWEANIARILNLFRIEWLYECKRFSFDNETNGVLSYQPDFYLPQYNKWIEVKGWMDEKSKKRLELFKKYYPEEFSNLILIENKEYIKISNKYSLVIDNWESKGNYKNKSKNEDNARTEIEVILQKDKKEC